MPQGDLYQDRYQNENGYSIDPELLTALIQDGGLNRRGLVYESIFKPINTNGACEVMGIDFTETADTAGDDTFSGKYDLMRESDNDMTCYSEPKELESPKFSRKHYEVKWYANRKALTECCLSMCGMSMQEVENLVQDLKLNHLVDTYLINREVAGKNLLLGQDLATPSTSSVWTAGWENGTFADLADCDNDTTAEGKAYDMGGVICDKDFDIQTVIQNLQSNFKETGPRNKMVLDRKALWALRRNLSLRGQGSQVPASISEDIIKSEFGIDEIVVADTFVNASTVGTARDLQKIWGKGFILMFQNDESITDIEDPRTRNNFAVDLKKYEQYIRTFNIPEAGENGVDYISHHYSYSPVIHNIKAGTLLYNAF